MQGSEEERSEEGWGDRRVEKAREVNRRAGIGSSRREETRRDEKIREEK